MIIFLYGKDGYRLKQNLDKIIGEYKKKHTSGMSFSILDTSEEPPRDLLAKLEDLVKTISFFNEKRLVIIKNPFSISKELAGFIKKWNMTEDKERIVALVECQNEVELIKKDKNFYSLLKTKPNTVKNTEPLSGKHLENWIIQEAARHSATIEPAAVKKMIDFIGNDSWQLSQEIQKLANYKNSEQACLDGPPAGRQGRLAPITTADVELLVKPKADLNIFEVVDAIANRNKLRAAKLLQDHLETGADPYYIFSMIAYQLRNLLRIKDLIKSAVPYAGIVKKTGLNPYVVKKTYEQSRKFELEELKQKFGVLVNLDIGTKNGEIDMIDGLYQFVFSL